MENVLVFAQQQFMLVIAFVVFVLLFLRHELAKGGQKLSCQQMVQALNSGNAVLLDIRDHKEYKDGHIVDSINIQHDKVNGSLQQLEKYRNKQIIIIDRMGQHSGNVVRYLSSNGFDAVRLGGGLAEWRQDNLPLVK